MHAPPSLATAVPADPSVQCADLYPPAALSWCAAALQPAAVAEAAARMNMPDVETAAAKVAAVLDR